MALSLNAGNVVSAVNADSARADRGAREAPPHCGKCYELRVHDTTTSHMFLVGDIFLVPKAGVSALIQQPVSIVLIWPAWSLAFVASREVADIPSQLVYNELDYPSLFSISR